MDKKFIIFVLVAAFGILGIVLIEIGAIYLWFQGRCDIGAYYYGDKSSLIEGVKVEIKDFWGHSIVVTTSNRLLNITLYFRGWYRVEATYRGSAKTLDIITVNARYSTNIGTIYVVLNKEDDTIRCIEYAKPPYI